MHPSIVHASGNKEVTCYQSEAFNTHSRKEQVSLFVNDFFICQYL